MFLRTIPSALNLSDIANCYSAYSYSPQRPLTNDIHRKVMCENGQMLSYEITGADWKESLLCAGLQFHSIYFSNPLSCTVNLEFVTRLLLHVACTVLL